MTDHGITATRWLAYAVGVVVVLGFLLSRYLKEG